MRIIVGLAPGVDPSPITEALRGLGADSVQGPTEALPDVLVANFGDEDASPLIDRIVRLPGVRYAEPDQLRTAFASTD
jgi:hypothetical protein